MRILSYLLIAVFLLAGCTSVFGQDEFRKFTPEQVRYVTRLAEEGDAKAQYYLGVACTNGLGVRKNQQKAFWWYRRAAEQGHADAQYNLGLSYLLGFSVPPDNQDALKWSRKAAEQGNAGGQHLLGLTSRVLQATLSRCLELHKGLLVKDLNTASFFSAAHATAGNGLE